MSEGTCLLSASLELTSVAVHGVDHVYLRGDEQGVYKTIEQNIAEFSG